MTTTGYIGTYMNASSNLTESKSEAYVTDAGTTG